MRRIVSSGPGLVVLLTALAALVVAPALVRRVGYAQTTARLRLATQSLDEDDILERISRAQMAIAEKVEPSVVHIDVRPEGGWHITRGAKGSGWVFDMRGHIITNAHVVRGLAEGEMARVEFSDGRATEARLIGADAFTDIAVLRTVAREGLFPAERATGEPLRKGQRVFAFGSPFGFKFSMTEGLVSGLGRDPRGTVGPQGFTNFIQTDAAVNPGNSGGPLVDTQGRIVGMNVAIATGSESEGTSDEGQSSGIAFAIPVAVIESVAEQIIDHGSIRRGFLGIMFRGEQSVAVEQDHSFWGTGIQVSSVNEGGPAWRGGLEPDDIVVKFNGDRIESPAQFRSRVATSPAESDVTLTVFRDDDFVDLDITLGEYPREQLVPEQVGGELGKLGVMVFPNGLTLRVRPGFAAASFGLETNMRITGVNGEPVESFQELAVALDNAGFLLGRAVKLNTIVPTEDGDEHRDVTIHSR